MLAHHGKDVPFNLFTMSDMHYRNGDKVQMNYKGLVGTNPDQTVSHLKVAYYAAQNVFSIFDNMLGRVSNFTAQASVTNALAAFAYTNKANGSSVVTLWFRGAPPAESNTTVPVDLVFSGVEFKAPVYADLRTGNVYALPPGENAFSFKQILLYEGLEAEVPTFAHLSMIWGPDGKRLSKRHGATSVEAYRDLGYLPEAIVNYLALLGWSLDGATTIIDSKTLTENFSLDRISKNPAIFDAEKLEWMNGVYIRDMPAEKFVELAAPWLEAAGLASAADIAERADWFARLAPLVSERVKHMDELAAKVEFFFRDVVIEDDARTKVLDKEGATEALEAASVALASVEWSAPAIEGAMRDLPERLGQKPKAVFQAIRVAITGSTVSPPLFESLELLGREESLKRLDMALGRP